MAPSAVWVDSLSSSAPAPATPALTVAVGQPLLARVPPCDGSRQSKAPAAASWRDFLKRNVVPELSKRTTLAGFLAWHCWLVRPLPAEAFTFELLNSSYHWSYALSPRKKPSSFTRESWRAEELPISQPSGTRTGTETAPWPIGMVCSTPSSLSGPSMTFGPSFALTICSGVGASSTPPKSTVVLRAPPAVLVAPKAVRPAPLPSGAYVTFLVPPSLNAPQPPVS